MSLTDEQVAVLKILFKAKPELRNALLKHADEHLVCTLCECVYNILRGNVPLKDQQKTKLAKYKTYLRSVVKKSKSWKGKRKVLQKGGNFLIPLLVPIIGSLFSKLIQ
jgi:hypothetical protein